MSEYATYSAANIPFTVPADGGYRDGSDVGHMEEHTYPRADSVIPRSFQQSSRRNRANTWQEPPTYTLHAPNKPRASRSGHCSPALAQPCGIPQKSRPVRSQSLMATSSQPTYIDVTHQPGPSAYQQPPSNLYAVHQTNHPPAVLPPSQMPPEHSSAYPPNIDWSHPQRYYSNSQIPHLRYGQPQQQTTQPTQRRSRTRESHSSLKRSFENILKVPLHGISNAELRFLILSAEGLILLAIIHLSLQVVNSAKNTLPLFIFVAGVGYLLTNVMNSV